MHDCTYVDVMTKEDTSESSMSEHALDATDVTVQEDSIPVVFSELPSDHLSTNGM